MTNHIESWVRNFVYSACVPLRLISIDFFSYLFRMQFYLIHTHIAHIHHAKCETNTTNRWCEIRALPAAYILSFVQCKIAPVWICLPTVFAQQYDRFRIIEIVCVNEEMKKKIWHLFDLCVKTTWNKRKSTNWNSTL